MTNAELIAKIKAEIERQENRYTNVEWFCEALTSFLDTIPVELPDKYETALEKAREWMPNVNQGGHVILIDIFPELGDGLDPRYGGRKQEQPEVDLEKELRNYNVPFDDCGWERLTHNTLKEIARHFWNKGYNARKEE